MRWMLGLFFAFLMLPALVAAPAQAVSSDSAAVPPVAVVTVQIVDADGTVLFSERVVTRTHDVTTASGGTHTCDGTNYGANPTPGPTVTGALDDAAKAYGFTFDGTYYPQFDDFFITTINGQSGTSNSYWAITVNGEYLQVGGCQYQVRTGDTITFTMTTF
jgi:hypothetical protein